MQPDNLLTAKYHAQHLADYAIVLYWMKSNEGNADFNADFHEQYMRNALAKIAKAMGYTLEPIAQDAQQAA